MRAIKTMVMLLGLVGFAVSSQGAAIDLPFSDDFDDTTKYTNGVAIPKTAWSYTIDAVATNSPTPKDGSALAVYAQDGMSLELNGAADSAPYSNVWYHCYAKVHTHTNDPAVGDAVAAFFLTSDGDLKAYSNNTWIVVSQEIVPTNDWLGFAVHLDFINEVWDLYRTPNGYTHGDNLVKQNAMPMDFNTNYTHSSELVAVEISGETYLDAVVLAEGSEPSISGSESPTNVTSSSNGIELILDETYTGVLLSYFGGSGTLSGPFGEALGSLLLAGDQVNIFIPTATNASWQVFTYGGPGQPWGHAGDEALDDPTITPTTGIFIKLDPDAEGTRAPAFVAAFDTVTSHTAGADTTLYGTNSNARGWNVLSLPFTAGAKSIVNGDASQLKLQDIAAEGDRIYLRKNGQWQPYMRFSGGLWVRGRTPVNETFPAGSGFWYRRNAIDTATWDSNTL